MPSTAMLSTPMSAGEVGEPTSFVRSFCCSWRRRCISAAIELDPCESSVEHGVTDMPCNERESDSASGSDRDSIERLESRCSEKSPPSEASPLPVHS